MCPGNDRAPQAVRALQRKPENCCNKARNAACEGSQKGKRQQVSPAIGVFWSRFLFTIHRLNAFLPPS